MKKIIIIITCVTIGLSTFGQTTKYVYVNTDYILKNIPEFTEAQKEIDKISEEWRVEVAKKQKEIDDLYKVFQNEQYLLTEEQKKNKVQEIENKEKGLKDYQKEKFGYEGALFQTRQELVKPIQDKVYDAIEKLAKERGYDFIFDKAGSTVILFADPKNDRSDDILRSLGYTPGTK
ncbi:MAG: OmpH family outer membrane protein [Chitinophagales bacterium]|nr:OmpH family outer membrane protein [Chitinophagales bacterium]